MKRFLIISLMIVNLIFVTSCGEFNYDEDSKYEMVEVLDVFNKAVAYDGGKTSLSLNKLVDEEANATLGYWEYISFFPKKDVKHEYYESLFFKVYTVDSYYDEILLKVSIVDEFITYEEKTVEKTDPATGETIFVTEMVEVDRKEQVIYLGSENGMIENLDGSEGTLFCVSLDYQIIDYSSSTAFKVEVLNTNGEPFELEWGIDSLNCLVVKEID